MIGEDDSSSKESSDGSGLVASDKSRSAETSATALLNSQVDPSCYRYENDKCFYVDPTSGAEYEWHEEKKEWTPSTSKSFSTLASKDYKYDGETYYYTDQKTKETYKWDKSKNNWVASGNDNKDIIQPSKKLVKSDDEEFDEDDSRPEIKRQDMTQGVYGYDGDSHTYTDSKDGTVYIWDKEKNAWFPKVDDDFIAQYQMNYGFTEPEDSTVPPSQPEAKPEQTSAEKPVESLKRKQEASWFDVDEKNNMKVYVSNLPLDLTEQEFVDLMQKCGLVMKEADSSKFKIKMYQDRNTKTFKGDALCTYIKIESVNLALNILDGYEIKGKKISVERAKFQMKGDYDPSLKPKKKSRKHMDKLKKIQEKLFDWRPDRMRGERGKHERVVIIKNLFDPVQFDKEVGLILEYQQDLREEASKCGNVKKITIFDRHPDGVAQIVFKEAEAADACIQLLHNRWFGQRQLSAETWDGKTKYIVAETDQQKEERLKKWQNFIEEEEKNKKANTSAQKPDSDDDTGSWAGSDDETDDENTKSPENSAIANQQSSGDS